MSGTDIYLNPMGMDHLFGVEKQRLFLSYMTDRELDSVIDNLRGRMHGPDGSDIIRSRWFRRLCAEKEKRVDRSRE